MSYNFLKTDIFSCVALDLLHKMAHPFGERRELMAEGWGREGDNPGLCHSSLEESGSLPT